MTINKSNIIPKIAILSFITMLATYAWDHYYIEHRVSLKNPSTKKNLVRPHSFLKNNNDLNNSKELSDNNLDGKNDKAYVIAVKKTIDDKLPIYEMHIPKNKHIYDEEKMNEIAKDADISPETNEVTAQE